MIAVADGLNEKLAATNCHDKRGSDQGGRQSASDQELGEGLQRKEAGDRSVRKRSGNGRDGGRK